MNYRIRKLTMKFLKNTKSTFLSNHSTKRLSMLTYRPNFKMFVFHCYGSNAFRYVIVFYI